VLDNYDKEYITKLNKELHSKNKGFIYAGNLGLYGFVFVDYGESHKVFDSTGEECKIAHIAGITQ
jgi:ubiquitin-activating enzyme E1